MNMKIKRQKGWTMLLLEDLYLEIVKKEDLLL